MSNKEFCEAVGLISHNPNLCIDLLCQGMNPMKPCEECKAYHIKKYPDFLSKTPESAFNRELLEECILRINKNDCYYKPLVKYLAEDDLHAFEIFSVTDGYDCSDDVPLYKSKDRDKGKALLLLATAIKDEIKEEISKVTEWIY